MTKGLVALILLTTLSLLRAAEIPQRIPLTVAELGDNLTLTCKIPQENWLFYWYEIKFGYMIQTIALGVSGQMKLLGKFKTPKFTVVNMGDQYNLTIRNVSKDDEATYICQAVEAFLMTFISGTIVAVKDWKNLQKHIYVKQSPETASVQPGHSTTLQCSLMFEHRENKVQCPDEHSVHWFRSGSGRTQPGVIYTQSNKSDGQKQWSCVYSLSKTIQNSSDTGTYYCAVVTCGQILFGEGTNVEMRQNQPLLVFGALMICSITVIAALWLILKK